MRKNYGMMFSIATGFDRSLGVQLMVCFRLELHWWMCGKVP